MHLSFPEDRELVEGKFGSSHMSVFYFHVATKTVVRSVDCQTDLHIVKDRENHRHIGSILHGIRYAHMKSVQEKGSILIACCRPYKHRFTRRLLENRFESFV